MASSLRTRRETPVRVFRSEREPVAAAPLLIRLRRFVAWAGWRYRYLAGFVLWGFLSILLELVLVTCLLPAAWPQVVRSFLGFVAGLLFAFAMNARFNFRVPPAQWARTFLLFVLVSVFSYGLNLAAVAGMAWVDWADYPAARLLSSASLCMIAYALHRRFTFRRSCRAIGLAVYAVAQEDLPHAYRQVGDQCDCLHIDLVDGTFAEEAIVDLDKLDEARRLWTWQPLHLHLMSRTPLRWIERCGERVECVLFHTDVDDDPMRVIVRCRQLGRQVGAVWSEGTHAAALLPLLPHVDFVMVLGILRKRTTTPGPPAGGRAGWRAWALAPQHRPMLYFLACMSLLFALALVRYPGTLLSNVPWAEEGKNLFQKAYYESLWNNLWGTDTGYLTSLPRFFSMVLVKMFGVREHFFLAVFTAMLLTSKAYFIAFLPVYGLVMLYGLAAKRRRMALFAAIGVAATVVQLGVMYVNRDVSPTAGTGLFANYGRRAFLQDNLLSLLSTYLEVFLNRNLLVTDRDCVYLVYAIAAILVAWLARTLWKRSKPMFWFFLGANALAVASLTISLLCVRWEFAEVDRCIPWDRLARLLPLRHYAFSSILITFATMVCLVRLSGGRRAQVATAVMLHLVVYNAGFFYSREGDNRKLVKFKSEPACHQWSRWDTCWQLIDEEDCFIPIKPYPWVIQRNNDYLNPDPMEDAERQRVTEVSFDARQQAAWRLRGLIAVKMRPSEPADAPTDAKPVRAVAYDAQNNRLAEARLLSPAGSDHLYLLFPRKLEHAARLTFVDEADQPRPVVSRIRYFGSAVPLPEPGAFACHQ